MYLTTSFHSILSPVSCDCLSQTILEVFQETQLPSATFDTIMLFLFLVCSLFQNLMRLQIIAFPDLGINCFHIQENWYICGSRDEFFNAQFKFTHAHLNLKIYWAKATSCTVVLCFTCLHFHFWIKWAIVPGNTWFLGNLNISSWTAFKLTITVAISLHKNVNDLILQNEADFYVRSCLCFHRHIGFFMWKTKNLFLLLSTN